jgi:hypothetical protein
MAEDLGQEGIFAEVGSGMSKRYKSAISVVSNLPENRL